MQGRIALEEHNGHAHLPPPVCNNALARADAGRRNKSNTVQHFLEGFLSAGGCLPLSRAEKCLCDLDKLLLARLVGERNLATFILRTVFQCCFFESRDDLEKLLNRRGSLSIVTEKFYGYFLFYFIEH